MDSPVKVFNCYIYFRAENLSEVSLDELVLDHGLGEEDVMIIEPKSKGKMAELYINEDKELSRPRHR